jgi:hypothetical protein
MLMIKYFPPCKYCGQSKVARDETCAGCGAPRPAVDPRAMNRPDLNQDREERRDERVGSRKIS